MITEKVDIYSFGIVLWQMVMPPPTPSVHLLHSWFAHRRHDELKPPILKLLELILRCTASRAETRPSASELVEWLVVAQLPDYLSSSMASLRSVIREYEQSLSSGSNARAPAFQVASTSHRSASAAAAALATAAVAIPASPSSNTINATLSLTQAAASYGFSPGSKANTWNSTPPGALLNAARANSASKPSGTIKTTFSSSSTQKSYGFTSESNG